MDEHENSHYLFENLWQHGGCTVQFFHFKPASIYEYHCPVSVHVHAMKAYGGGGYVLPTQHPIQLDTKGFFMGK